MGIAHSRIAGVRGTGFTAITLHGSEVTDTILEAAVELVNKGAGAIILGCAVSFESFVVAADRRAVLLRRHASSRAWPQSGKN